MWQLSGSLWNFRCLLFKTYFGWVWLFPHRNARRFQYKGTPSADQVNWRSSISNIAAKPCGFIRNQVQSISGETKFRDFQLVIPGSHRSKCLVYVMAVIPSFEMIKIGLLLWLSSWFRCFKPGKVSRILGDKNQQVCIASIRFKTPHLEPQAQLHLDPGTSSETREWETPDRQETIQNGVDWTKTHPSKSPSRYPVPSLLLWPFFSSCPHNVDWILSNCGIW